MKHEPEDNHPLVAAIRDKQIKAGVIGLGYVGLPLAMSISRAGFHTLGFDIDTEKIVRIDKGKSYIEAVTDDVLAEETGSGRFCATTDFTRLKECDVIAICVPTPLTRYRDPDLSYVENTCREIAKTLRQGQLIVLESTTYPGTTEEVMRPILEGAGLRAGQDFYLGYSPEREDPGNREFNTSTIPKVVAGDGELASAMMRAFYGSVVETIVPVASVRTAEAVKLTENIFRAVNIALVNELKLVYDAMGIDVWDVIEAAKTKPFGYMPFYPGPGLGGHCIPIDPFYLTWKSREFEQPTRFIELAGEINTSMPRYVIEKLAEALDRRLGKALSRSRILIMGLAYKKNVPDIRESPSLRLMELLIERGAEVEYHDPFLDEVPRTREYGHLKGRRSVQAEADNLAGFDAAVIATDHDGVDYARLATHVPLVVDTRNVYARRSLAFDNIVKA
ncbi:nucleotide sugar dehydrogenase [Rhizobium helianthi]|uniref:Nucleotide sugar dehydrogenase n=1 Tax=Rhizobium helianthi TaxID=1132695 RepID=A0ABW4M396_9HYPH